MFTTTTLFKALQVSDVIQINATFVDNIDKDDPELYIATSNAGGPEIYMKDQEIQIHPSLGISGIKATINGEEVLCTIRFLKTIPIGELDIKGSV